MLPGLGGFDVCRLARERYAGGILMLTASKAEVDQAVGLELGADDYVVKPVEPRILLARIRSLLRRLRGTLVGPGSTARTVGRALTINRERREVAGRATRSSSPRSSSTCCGCWRAGPAKSSAGKSCTSRFEASNTTASIAAWTSTYRASATSWRPSGSMPASLKSVRGMGYLLVKR